MQHEPGRPVEVERPGRLQIGQFALRRRCQHSHEALAAQGDEGLAVQEVPLHVAHGRRARLQRGQGQLERALAGEVDRAADRNRAPVIVKIEPWCMRTASQKLTERCQRLRRGGLDGQEPGREVR